MTNKMTEDKIETFHFADCLYPLLFLVSAMGEAECKTSRRGSGYWELFKKQQYYICLSHAVSCTPLSAVFHKSQLPFPAERWLLLWEGGTESCVGSCFAAAQLFVSCLSCWCPDSWRSLVIAHNSLMSRIFLCLRGLTSIESVDLLLC